MDIKCPFCREPWELDCLHDMVSEGHALDFEDARETFYRIGCPAFDGGISPCTHGGKGRDPLLSAIYEMAGDDIDGAASDIEDAEFLGLFE